MPGLFGILELGKRTLISQQFAQNIVGNNIANVNTEGYSRQRTQFKQFGNINTPWGRMGLGVQVEKVIRSRDALIDRLYREGQGTLKEWEMRAQFLQQIDTAFSEVDESGLGAQLDAFFSAWYDLANDPENAQPRIALKERALALTDTFHRIVRKLKDQKQNINTRIEKNVKAVNSLVKKIAAINAKIPASTTSTGVSNDLLDERDRLIDELAGLVDVQVIERSDGRVGVYIGSINMVEGAYFQTLSLKYESDGSTTIARVLLPTNETFSPTRGELKALLDLRDDLIPSYEKSLDTLAQNLVEQINAYHKVGYNPDGETNLNFFDNRYITAETIRLDETILNNPEKIAAAAVDEIGDNTQALRIAALKDAGLIGGVSFREYYAALITRVGLDGQEANDFLKNQEIFVNQTALQREQVTGVSLDEEMVDMIKYQQTYLAAARMITTADSMIEAIINLK